MPPMNTRNLSTLLLATLAATLFTGCESNIHPMRPLERAYIWVPDETPTTTPAATMSASTEPTTEPLATSQPTTTQTADTSPATFPATQTASANTQPTTRPGKTIIEITDPNQTARFIYKADYDNIWRQSLDILTKAGFLQDRMDFRLGVMTTQPLPSSQIIEFWRPQQTTIKNSIENTMHNQRRRVRITISTVPKKPDFYQIAVQVLVERQSNPAEVIGGPVFVEGSGFGRATVSLRSDYAVAGKTDQPAFWVLIGHDPNLEKKLLTQLFNRI